MKPLAVPKGLTQSVLAKYGVKAVDSSVEESVKLKSVTLIHSVKSPKSSDESSIFPPPLYPAGYRVSLEGAIVRVESVNAEGVTDAETCIPLTNVRCFVPDTEAKKK